MAPLDMSKLGVLLHLVLCVAVAVVATNETAPAPWGTVIGVTSGVKVYSNDNPPPTDSYNFYPNGTNETNGAFTGLRWQCVELARRYLLVTQGVVFESVDDVVGIFSLREVINVTTNKRLPLDVYPQGSPVPPKGSLVIWDRPGYYTPYGHVAVVINIQDTFIDVAEENLENIYWQPSAYYSRRIRVSRTPSAFHVEPYYNQPNKSEIVLGWATFSPRQAC
ncbi:hypothetical protein AC1031_006237 [Aphanomyces cochlioides]|nr:hypothetical protein AC1031_006237 [Aphanomyces cochlioides]